MIATDQPTCFPPELRVAVSSRNDGTMLDRNLADRHDPSVVAHRQEFARQAGMNYDDAVYQIILYDDNQTYDTIAEVDRPDTQGICADALYTERAGIGLFLPVADCVATVVYDPIRRALALAHLGRHASVARLMTKLIEFMKEHGSDPSQLIIWMAPSVGRTSYRMAYFDHADEVEWTGFVDRHDDGIYLDLAGFNANLALQAGVDSQHIYRSPVDTATNHDYFSHSQGDENGRFAIIAQIR
jgi:copper oxidase (laccase) domain-containing protein